MEDSGWCLQLWESVDVVIQISGANVVVHDPRAGATEGVVVVMGTPDQLRAAQSLIHAFILSERDI